ncbi:hypothetical protein BKA70DRAFT_1541367 [Coprinopsis sp. MPI-PUGE-AT-0042]|nr:hypothetical protein BKA70DRAFT_1541367 [Coprinopsis sp. MPI-PUGE-AT-0042]
MPHKVRAQDLEKAEQSVQAWWRPWKDLTAFFLPSFHPEFGTRANSQHYRVTFTEIQNQTNVQYVINDERDTKLFSMLNPVSAAHDCQEVASKVTECFSGTRRQLLLDIEKWRTSDSSVPIFILDGIAGIGKTTVVKTVCTRAAAERGLAGSWFFSRDQQDRRTTRGFVAALAFQLASYHPSLRERISQALEDHPDVLQKTIRVQFDTLIHEPLQAVFLELGGTHTISIDAIDECDLDEAVEVLSILLGSVPKLPHLRLLISCRPNRPSDCFFRSIAALTSSTCMTSRPRLSNPTSVCTSTTASLRGKLMRHSLISFPSLACIGKGKEYLVQMAGKLFIVASTAIDFILDPRRLDPGRQIRKLLDANTGSGLASTPMDRLYTQVLRTAVPEPVDDWFGDYQVIVGAIVVASDILPVQSLASLLDKDPNDIIRTLSNLHSLIAPTNRDEAYRVHHKSFTDFVTDPSRCSIDPRFLIDASAAHFYLARGCLRVMVRTLKQNICDLPLSDWNKERSQLAPGTLDRIPPELAYACTHWIPHFQQGLSHFSASEDAALATQLNLFVDGHLLSWLEVLALTSRFDTAWRSVDMLSKAISLILSTATGKTLETLSHVSEALQDCLRFIALHPNLPRLFPMHIYLFSALFT